MNRLPMPLDHTPAHPRRALIATDTLVLWGLCLFGAGFTSALLLACEILRHCPP